MLTSRDKDETMTTPANLALYVATYSDAAAAREDFDALKAAQGADLQVVAAVVMSRDAQGQVDVLSEGDGMTGGGAVLGGGVGLVVGLFAPPLLAATAVGAGIGALLGHLTKKHAEKELGVELEEYLPPDSSAVVVVVDDVYLDRVEAALTKAVKRISKAVDSGDYDKLEKALAKSEDQVSKAAEG
jgi:uncharacterized membrane protein